MEKAFRICLSSISVFGLFLFLSGCGGTMQITDKVSNELKPDVLYKSYNIQPTDLSQKSECKMAPTVKLVNIENRTENFEVLRNPPVFTGYVSPKEMMDSVLLYLKNGFEQSNIKVDDVSTKVIQLKMLDLKSIAGFWSFGSYFKMQLLIPEKNLSKIYEANDNSGNGFSATAYAIHVVTRQIIDDPSVQDYILCK